MGIFTHGALYKIGYGFSKKLHYVYKFEEAKPQNVKSIDFKQVNIGAVLTTSSTLLINFKLGCLLEDQVLKMMDFHVINDDKKYYLFEMHICTRKESCSGYKQLPENTEYYVRRVSYGSHLAVLIPKNEFLNNQIETKSLLESAVEDLNKLTEDQKHIQCRVLVNNMEEKEMTLEEIFKFKNDCLDGLHVDDEISVHVEVKKNKNVAFAVENESRFKEFLSNVYTLYRKIEMKLESAGHSGIVPPPKRSTSFNRILSNLASAKEKYLELDLNNDDKFKVYSVLKTLFWNYRYYLEYVIDKRLNLDEGEDLPPGWEEEGDVGQVLDDFKLLSTTLNTWTPQIQIGDVLYETTGKLLVVPEDFDGIEKKIVLLKGHIVVEKNDKMEEPHLLIHPEMNGLFGFVDMSKPSPTDANAKNLKYLTLKCPENCSKDERKWICQKCGDVIRKKKFYLFCSCGTKIFEKQIFVCNHPRHEIHLMKTASLKTIAFQLRKHQDRNDVGTNNVIKNAVKSIVKIDQHSEEIKFILLKMKNLNLFDGDTGHLIDVYLNAGQSSQGDEEI